MDSFVHLHTHSEFCLAPNTRVATADLHWVPISKVEIGDELVGFDEQLTGSKMKRTVVESKRELVMPSYRITMEDGSEIVASDLHLWVVIDGPGHIRLPDGPFRSNGNHSRKWCKTKDLIPGKHKIVKWASPWGELSSDQLYDAVGIVSVEFLGDVEVVGIQTSERTFVAEGFLTHNSMLDGHSKIEDLVKAVAADGQPALGITDHGNMYGIIPFYNACKEHGVKPILGSELYQAQSHVSDRPKTRKKVVDDTGDTGQDGGGKLYYHLTVLAETQEGYHNLVKLSSESFIRDDAYYYKPRVDWEMLDEYHEGLIITSGCLGGQVLQSLLRDDYTVARHIAGKFQDIFGRDNFFIEIQDHGLPEQSKTNPGLIRLAGDIGAPLLLTNDSHYVHREDHIKHDALLCCQTKSKLKEKDRFKFEGQEHYVKTSEEMRGLFPEVKVASDNTLWIAERCDVEIEMGVASLPHVSTPEGYEDNLEYLMEKCVEGCFERYGAPIPGEALERLRYEIETVNDMGFIDYFLIVGDLIDYARERGIRVGPGRGSAAGSIIAYSLGITDIDPLRYGLMFERFLNPARVSMPDIIDYPLELSDDYNNSRHNKGKRTLYGGYTTDKGSLSKWLVGARDSK